VGHHHAGIDCCFDDHAGFHDVWLDTATAMGIYYLLDCVYFSSRSPITQGFTPERERRMKLFFKIETETNPNALRFLPKPKPPVHWKDPNKIAKWIEEKRVDQVEKASLDLDMARITAIGLRMGEDGETVARAVNENFPEDRLIYLFWRCFRKCSGESVGYNTISFDFPMIMRRSWELGILPTIFPDLRRYMKWPTADLMQILAGWQKDQCKSLKFICERYGIDNQMPALDGSVVSLMDEPTKLIYAKNNVNMIFQLYQKMKGYYL
jgi:hypothetical protein